MADTIYALASGAPPAAIAVVRLSGPAARDALVRLTGRGAPPPRRIALRTLRDPEGGLLDRALVVWSPAPDTATGEETAELHLHGGRAVVAAVLAALAALPGLRAAGPGEFTRRAFAVGKLDLGEAEALADLIAAETEQQRRLALGRLDGRFARAMEEWRVRLLAIAAQTEAAIEFGEEDPLATGDAALPRAAIAALAAEIEATLTAPPAERLRDGLRVVIAGPPNAGKSTLLNALAERPAAIVSPIAGTTRDLIEAPLALAGVPFVLIDTAGLRGAPDPIEAEGVARAQAALAAADILLWLGPPDAAPDVPGAMLVRVAAKADLEPATPGADISVSALRGTGLAELRALLVQQASALAPREDQLSLSLRQHDAMTEARDALVSAGLEVDELIAAAQIQLALAAFDRAIGRTATEDMLDALFGSLCIGK